MSEGKRSMCVLFCSNLSFDILSPPFSHRRRRRGCMMGVGVCMNGGCGCMYV